MSVVQKISFKAGDSSLFNQARFSQPQPVQNAYAQSPIQNAVISDDEEIKKQIKNAKTLTYVGSALALVSLGVAGIVAAKSGKKMPKSNTEDLVNPLKNSISQVADSVDFLAKRFDDADSLLTEDLANVYGRIDEKFRMLEGRIDGARNELHGQMDSLSRQKSQLTSNFFPIDVTINGRKMRLANVLSEIYGDARANLEKELQQEASKRILGLVDRSKMTPPEFAWVRMPTSEVRPFTNTGGLSVVPKELIANLAGMMNTRQKAGLLLDTPMYTGNVANNQYYRLQRSDDGSDSFKYIKKFFDAKSGKYKEETLADVELIDKMHLPIYTDKGRTMEDVNVFMTKEMRAKIDFDLLSERLDFDVLDDIDKTLKSDKVWENELLRIYKDKESGLPVAEAKYKTVLYDSEKFNLDGRTGAGNISIYRNDAMETGETERMVYFSKFFAEHLMNGDTSKVKLGADLIIGNDWHTGPISAMIRQLTTARKYYGMDPEKAGKLHDVPIVTLMHNAGVTGNAYHSQEKLLNIMFGEHATKIVTNSFMPNVRIGEKGGLPTDLHNAMMSKDCVHPQIMAANYSDVLVPVSPNYGVEIASHSGFGGEAHDIMKIRARMWEYADLDNIKFIAKQNDLDVSLVTDKPTMKGIANGCDAVNNRLTAAKARNVEDAIGLQNGSIKILKAGDDVVPWHKHNKGVYLEKVISDIDTARVSAGKNNPMNIELPEITDLTGVTVDTPVYSTAGRIVDQKGLDIFAQSIMEFYKNFKGTDYPVFYAQGVGDEVYVKALLHVKQELAKTNPEAAKRIVFARLFSEPGRYDGCKLMSDYSIMSSWFEPCGLVHKEIAKYSGAIPILLKVGGLPAGLTHMKNAIFADYKHRFDNYEEALMFNAKTMAGAMQKGYDLMKNAKADFAKILECSQKTDHSWLVHGGPMDEYLDIFIDLKAFKPEILNVKKPMKSKSHAKSESVSQGIQITKDSSKPVKGKSSGRKKKSGK